VLRRIFGPRRAEETGDWRKVCNEKLQCSYISLNIITVITSRRIIWAVRVERVK